MSFDLNSLYPHLIMQYNISPETLRETRHPSVTVDKILNQEALVFIRLRSQVDDSPGNAVRDACKRLSELNIKKLRLGKVIDVWLEAETREYAEKELEMLSDRFLANTVMEDWDYELTEIETFPQGIE